jgi:hypothetical protein
MTITTPAPWLALLAPDDLVALKFYTDDAATKYVVDVARFDGLNDDGDLAYFTSTFDDADPYTWTAYIGPDGSTACYGNFDKKLDRLTHDNAGIA